MAIVHTPAGKCPCRLVGFTEDNIADWCINVIHKGAAANPVSNYSPKALMYWIVNDVWHDKFMENPKHKDFDMARRVISGLSIFKAETKSEHVGIGRE